MRRCGELKHFDMQKNHPLVTFCVVSFNQEAYIEATVRAVFAQTYDALEILFSDDASTDRTYAIIQEMVADYRGPHRIRLNRNPQNMGLAAHITKIFTLFSGELVFLGAGDDISTPDRVAVTVDAWLNTNQHAVAIYASSMEIDAEGRLIGPSTQLPETVLDTRPPLLKMRDPLLNGSTDAYAASFVRNVVIPQGSAEDEYLYMRAALVGDCLLIQNGLNHYRFHPQSMSSNAGRTFIERQVRRYTWKKQCMLDLHQKLDALLDQRHFPHEKRSAIRRFIQGQIVKSEVVLKLAQSRRGRILSWLEHHPIWKGVFFRPMRACFRLCVHSERALCMLGIKRIGAM